MQDPNLLSALLFSGSAAFIQPRSAVPDSLSHTHSYICPRALPFTAISTYNQRVEMRLPLYKPLVCVFQAQRDVQAN